MDCLTFAAGQVATLTAQFVISPTGQPVDVPDAKVAVYDGDATVLPETDMIHVLTGFYYYDWIIPNSLPPKTYTVRYTGTVAGVSTAATAYAKVLPAGTPPGVVQTSSQVDAIAALEIYLGCAQKIPVYQEVSRRNKDRDAFQLTWPRWNLGNHAVFINKDETLDAKIDLNTGTVRFDSPLHPTDQVSATYTFRFFADTELLRFINDAISWFNMEPPGTNFIIENLPDNAIGTVMLGAAAAGIRKLLMCINFQEPQTIFGGKEAAQQAHSNFMSLKQNYEDSFNLYKKQYKRARWPSTVANVQPEYTLPGGRSRWFRYLFSSGG